MLVPTAISRRSGLFSPAFDDINKGSEQRESIWYKLPRTPECDGAQIFAPEKAKVDDDIYL